MSEKTRKRGRGRPAAAQFKQADPDAGTSAAQVPAASGHADSDATVTEIHNPPGTGNKQTSDREARRRRSISRERVLNALGAMTASRSIGLLSAEDLDEAHELIERLDGNTDPETLDVVRSAMFVLLDKITAKHGQNVLVPADIVKRVPGILGLPQTPPASIARPSRNVDEDEVRVPLQDVHMVIDVEPQTAYILRTRGVLPPPGPDGCYERAALLRWAFKHGYKPRDPRDLTGSGELLSAA